MLETIEDFRQARESLEKPSTQELAGFILNLAPVTSNIVGTYVQVFCLADEPEEAGALIAREIGLIAGGEREYDYRHRRGSAEYSRIERTFDAIETIILPRNTALAVALLEQFISHGDAMLQHCEDEPVGDLIGRAQKLLQSLTASR